MELREQVEWFSFEMEKVLRDNDHKRGLFDNMDSGDLMHRLNQEVMELEAAFADYEEDEDDMEDDIKEEIKKEAVDVANFAMAIAWKVRK